jgi:2-polyprenyl-3-methyl-5-hydroxy-6-metoxy-1,4-benzoquinol methylase
MESSNNGAYQQDEGGTNQREFNKKSPKSSTTANNNKKKRDQFKFGNYRNYYFKRLGAGEQQTDFRLELLKAHPDCFKGKKVLDIGCNSGFITINFAKLLLPASVLGIDIDGSLVDRARSELEKEKSEGEFSEQVGEALNHVIFKKVS